MTLKELLKDSYRDGMTPEEIDKALQGLREPLNPMQAYETDKLKAAVTKANAEAAKLKRELQARMSEEERREAERKAKEDEVHEQLAELRRAKIVADTKAQFLALGYEPELADKAAVASADGDYGTLFLAQKQHQDALVKKIRGDMLKATPKPSGGQTIPKNLTKEQFDGLSYRERLALFNENPDLYKELNGE